MHYERNLPTFFNKMGQPRPLFHLFLSFQIHFTFFTTNKCEKCPSSIQCWDSNSKPLEHKSPPITTRPGLFNVGPMYASYYLQLKNIIRTDLYLQPFYYDVYTYSLRIGLCNEI